MDGLNASGQLHGTELEVEGGTFKCQSTRKPAIWFKRAGLAERGECDAAQRL
jgi:hypothetical protein